MRRDDNQPCCLALSQLHGIGGGSDNDNIFGTRIRSPNGSDRSSIINHYRTLKYTVRKDNPNQTAREDWSSPSFP